MKRMITVLVAVGCGMLVGCSTYESTIISDVPPTAGPSEVIRTESTRVISEQPVIGKPAGHPGAGKGAGWVE